MAVASPLLLDIMVGSKFLCQLKYTKRGFPEFIDGKFIEVHNLDDIKSFIETQRPSLKDKNYRIEFSNQKILAR